jgi:uncharacterized protein (TIGR03083 family)
MGIAINTFSRAVAERASTKTGSVDIAAHIAALQSDGDLMTAAVRSTDPDAPVPTCPEWVLRDLVRHLGGVHRWATSYVAEARADYTPADLEQLSGGWPDDAELAEWFADGHARLVGALTAAPPDLECWTFLPAPSPLAMWARRQAHETAIHRVDTELTARSSVGGLAAPFAGDGVDELLTCFVPRRSATLHAHEPTTFAVRCTDDAGAWVLDIGPQGASTVSGDGSGDAACTLSGKAGDLYLALWNRGGGDTLEAAGDRAVLDLFLEGVEVRWKPQNASERRGLHRRAAAPPRLRVTAAPPARPPGTAL